MDVKYGYISGADRFFFQLSAIDVYTREVVGYHLGLSCTAKDAVRVISRALTKRRIEGGDTKGLVLRTDNGPQFIANVFVKACEELGIVHERIPVRTPNMNAHIESFHAILEEECYSQNEFESFIDVYATVSQYMEYYNERRRHGSLGYKAPSQFHEAFLRNNAKGIAIVA